MSTRMLAFLLSCVLSALPWSVLADDAVEAKPAAPVPAPSTSAETAGTELPFPTQATLRSMLAQQRFGQLGTMLDAYRLAANKLISLNEDALIQAYRAFSVSDLKVLAELDSWVDAQPKSYQALTSRSFCYLQLGIEARGGKWRSETSEDQINAMSRYMFLAERDARSALALQPDNIAPYRVLVILGKYQSNEKMLSATREALKAFPASFYIRVNAIDAMQPRWGGSYAQMLAFAEESQKYADINPILKQMLGYPYWARGRDLETAKQYEAAYEQYSKALEYGDATDFLRSHNEMALELKHYREAFDDARRHQRVDPERPAESEIVSDTRQAVWDAAAELYRAGKLRGAVDIYSLLIEQNADKDGALTWRGIAYARLGETEPALSDLRAAVAINPANPNAAAWLPRVLYSAGKKDEAIEALKTYLQHKPQDSNLHLQLASLYDATLHREEALASAKQACTLGNDEACAFAAKLAARAAPSSGSPP